MSIRQWLAVQYDSSAREQSLGALGVQGIPMLSIVAPNGQIVEKNAVQVARHLSLSSASLESTATAKLPLLDAQLRALRFVRDQTPAAFLLHAGRRAATC